MNQFLKKFQNQSIHIMGYGVEGSTTTKFLLDQGIEASQITIHDSSDDKELPTGTIGMLGNEFGNGIDHADIIFRTAGIPLHHDVFDGIPKEKITSQAQLFFDYFPGEKIGITGSKGKSTTTCMIHHMLHKAGKKSILVGNIGAGRLTDIDRSDSECIAVCELSSGQLEGLRLELDVGVFTNFYPIHHIGWHGSLKNYRNAKLQLVKNSKILILASQIVQTQSEIMHHVGETEILEYGPQGDYRFSNGVFLSKNGSILGNDAAMQLIGDHNRENACVLFALCNVLGLEYTYAQYTIDTFTGLPHRLENVGVVNGITRINDAIATTPQATMAAIATLGEQLETIFLGGKDEGYDYEELCAILNTHTSLKNIILFPDTHDVYLKQLNDSKLSIHVCHSMHEAVQFANHATTSGKVALLSCATPSMSLRTSYRQKGDQFRDEVEKLEE